MTRANSIEEYREQAAASKGKPSRIPRHAKKGRMQVPAPTEHDEQVALFQWVERAAATVAGELTMLFAIPNSGAGAQAGRAGWMKAEGVKAGVPDLFLPVPVGNYHGCFIEVKTRDGAVRPEQEVWLLALKEQGYFTRVCYGFTEARDTLLGYLRDEF